MPPRKYTEIITSRLLDIQEEDFTFGSQAGALAAKAMDPAPARNPRRESESYSEQA
jgi:hypothetical protein